MFDGQHVLLTGASSGIGLEMARLFATAGARLSLVARRRERLEGLVAELRHARPGESSEGAADPFVPIVADLRDANDAVNAYARATERLGPVDILVNNAGIGEYGPFNDQETSVLDDMIRLNVTAVVVLSRLAGQDMASHGRGRILNIASMAAFQPTPYMSAYGATKAFVLNFSVALDAELRRRGVRVTCVCPGGVRTEFLRRGGYETRADDWDRFLADPAWIARSALHALARGRRVHIPGVGNRLVIAAERLLPMQWVTKIAARALRPKARL